MENCTKKNYPKMGNCNEKRVKAGQAAAG